MFFYDLKPKGFKRMRQTSIKLQIELMLNRRIDNNLCNVKLGRNSMHKPEENQQRFLSIQVYTAAIGMQ